MSVQTTVNRYLSPGFVGKLVNAGNGAPVRAQVYTVNSASAAYNVIGRGFSITSQGFAAAGNAGGALPFAGILVCPQDNISFGNNSQGPLGPSLTLHNYDQGTCATMGSFYVNLPAAADIGDLVVYDNTTGALSTIAPGDDLPVGKSFAYALVDIFTVTDAGIAAITLTPTLTIPQLATPPSPQLATPPSPQLATPQLTERGK